MRYISVIGGVVTVLVFAATASAGSFGNKTPVTVMSNAAYELNDQIVKIEKDAYSIGKASGGVVRVAATEGAHASDSATTGDVDVAIDISEKSFHITKGGTDRGFTLIAGKPTVIQLRNRDLVTHEFVSTLFREVQFRMSG